jgi:hypothetical protein
MTSFEIQNMIIDDDFAVEEYVTVDFTSDQKDYSITFKKADLEVINAWKFENGTSLPANLSESIIESIRDNVKKQLH